MSITGYQRLTGILTVLTVVLVLLCGWLVWRLGWLTVEVAFADDQIVIFEEMTTQPDKVALRRGRRLIPHIVSIGYYPSGSKQQTGSSLDRMVERQRAQAVREIITSLRLKTGEDLGDRPEEWIRKFHAR